MVVLAGRCLRVLARAEMSYLLQRKMRGFYSRFLWVIFWLFFLRAFNVLSIFRYRFAVDGLCAFLVSG